MILCISVLSVVISPFSFLILLIWVFSLCFLMNLVNGLSILFILSKNQLLALLIFAMVSFVSFAFIHFLFSFRGSESCKLNTHSFHPPATYPPSWVWCRSNRERLPQWVSWMSFPESQGRQMCWGLGELWWSGPRRTSWLSRSKDQRPPGSAHITRDAGNRCRW